MPTPKSLHCSCHFLSLSFLSDRESDQKRKDKKCTALVFEGDDSRLMFTHGLLLEKKDVLVYNDQHRNGFQNDSAIVSVKALQARPTFLAQSGLPA